MVSFFNTVLYARFYSPTYDSLVLWRNIVILFSYSRVLAVIEVIILANFKVDGTNAGEKTEIFGSRSYPARKRHIAKSTGRSTITVKLNDQFLIRSYKSNV